MLKSHLKYLGYVLRHKWFVFRAGRRLGLGFFQLLVHDLSKFSRAEWGPYVRKFYGGPHPEKLGGFTPRNGKYPRTQEDVRRDFDAAWLHHQHANPHHWQHWVLRSDNGETKILQMPRRYAVEMVADWFGAGRGITGKWGAKAWYEANRDKIRLHPNTRAFVEHLLNTVTIGD